MIAHVSELYICGINVDDRRGSTDCAILPSVLDEISLAEKLVHCRTSLS